MRVKKTYLSDYHSARPVPESAWFDDAASCRAHMRQTGGSFPQRKQNSLITLQQDADGFIRMNRHYPNSVRIRITFTDGSTGEFSGQTLNNAYDAALAEFRAKNDLDARGYSRTSAGRTNSGNKIDFVPVHPGMQE
jgi:hypothetical protein